MLVGFVSSWMVIEEEVCHADSHVALATTSNHIPFRKGSERPIRKIYDFSLNFGCLSGWCSHLAFWYKKTLSPTQAYTRKFPEITESTQNKSFKQIA